MLIVGAKGFAKEVLEIQYQLKDIENLVFYDDVNINIEDILYNQFPVLKSIEKAKQYFDTVEKRFTIGIGNPNLRCNLYQKFSDIGGDFTSTISPKADIGNFGNTISTGSNIMTGTIITNDVKIGEGALINLNCTVGHDCTIGKFVELSPGVHVSGNCQIGDFTEIGTNATILPKITIGKNVTIGAGTVVTKNIPDDAVVVGIPGKIIKFKNE